MIKTGCFSFHVNCFKPKEIRPKLYSRVTGVTFLLLLFMHTSAQDRQMPARRIGSLSTVSESGKAQQQAGKAIAGESARKRTEDARKTETQLFELSTNPVGSHLYVNSLIELPAGKFTIQIMNIKGKLLYTVLLVTGTTRMNVSKFTSGTYLFEIKKDQKILQTGRFIKQ